MTGAAHLALRTALAVLPAGCCALVALEAARLIVIAGAARWSRNAPIVAIVLGGLAGVAATIALVWP